MPEDDQLPAHLEAALGPFYDRQGNPITWTEWSRKKLSDGPDRDDRVGLDTVNGTEISTVWLGSPAGKDWGHASSAPLIFETLVTDRDGSRVFARYCTEAEAEDGHRQVVARFSG